MDDKNENTREENTEPVSPYVNEKVKYFIFAFVVIFCIIAALSVIFSPEAKEKRNNDGGKSGNSAVITVNLLNT